MYTSQKKILQNICIRYFLSHNVLSKYEDMSFTSIASK